MYSPVKLEDFAERMIEITVWDFDRIGASEFLGEVRVVCYCCYCAHCLVIVCTKYTKCVFLVDGKAF